MEDREGAWDHLPDHVARAADEVIELDVCMAALGQDAILKDVRGSRVYPNTRPYCGDRSEPPLRATPDSWTAANAARG